MKITLTRDEVYELIKEHYGIKTDFQFFIQNEEKSVKKEEEIPEYEIKTDSEGRITSMVPVGVPSYYKDVRGKEWKYQKTCKVCGKNFYTNNNSFSTCSKECMDKIKKRSKSKQLHKLPSKPKIDYSKYGILIEEFLKSADKEILVDNEGITAAGIKDRYDVAARMFDLRNKITISTNTKTNICRIRKVKA